MDKLATQVRQLRVLENFSGYAGLTKQNELGILVPWQAYRIYPDDLFLSSCRVYPS